MDTTSKMFYIAAQDEDYLPVLSVMCDLMMNKMDKNTIKNARKIEVNFPDLWNENQWLRMVGGSNLKNSDKKWIEYLRKEMEDEFNEKKEKNKDK